MPTLYDWYAPEAMLRHSLPYAAQNAQEHSSEAGEQGRRTDQTDLAIALWNLAMRNGFICC